MQAEPQAERSGFSGTFRESKWLRILLLAHLAGLSGYLIYSSIDIKTGLLPFPVVAGLTYFCVIGATSAILIALKPAFCALLEFMAASRLLLALAVVQNPDLGLRVISSPLLSASLVIGGALVLRLLTPLARRLAVPREYIHTPT
jgi:hypothetical protein